MHTFHGSYMHHDRSGMTCVQLIVTTDFAARTDVAKRGADRIAMAAHGAGECTRDSILCAAHPDGGTVADAIASLGRHLGEETRLRTVARVGTSGVEHVSFCS